VSAVCKSCGLRRDRITEPAACSGNTQGHQWTEEVAPLARGAVPSTRRIDPIIQQTLIWGSVLVAVVVVLANYGTQIENAGKLAAVFVLEAVEWILSWPAWVWICLSILYAAKRIANAIDRHKTKPE
jgi:hypothetical protein